MVYWSENKRFLLLFVLSCAVWTHEPPPSSLHLAVPPVLTPDCSIHCSIYRSSLTKKMQQQVRPAKISDGGRLHCHHRVHPDLLHHRLVGCLHLQGRSRLLRVIQSAEICHRSRTCMTPRLCFITTKASHLINSFFPTAVGLSNKTQVLHWNSVCAMETTWCSTLMQQLYCCSLILLRFISHWNVFTHSGMNVYIRNLSANFCLHLGLKLVLHQLTKTS